MHPDLKNVIELQQVDQKIAELTKQIESLPAEIQSLQSRLDEFIHAQEERKKRLAANQKERKDLDGEIKVIQEKIARHKDQLYQVKTNEQFRAMTKEIEGEEAKFGPSRTKSWRRCWKRRSIQQHIQEAAARLDSEKAQVAAEVARLESERKADDDERTRLQTRRNEIQDGLSESTRNLYQRIRQARRGMAVAEVREGLCTACNVLLRPQVYNEVRTNEVLLTCENCGRIIYYVEPAPAQTGEVKRPRRRSNGLRILHRLNSRMPITPIIGRRHRKKREFRESHRPMAKSPDVIAHIDGASRGNPGPAAYAVVMESSDGSRLAGFSEYLGEATNNFAEYQALLAALEYALSNHYMRIHVQTDSELVARQIEGVYKVKSPGLKPLQERARQMIARLESFSIQHVPREKNHEADRLANQALDAAERGVEEGPGRRPVGPGPGRTARPLRRKFRPLRASATFHKGLLEPHGQLPLFEGEVVDLEIYRKRRFNVTTNGEMCEARQRTSRSRGAPVER